jgi:hypothetical protein
MWIIIPANPVRMNRFNFSYLYSKSDTLNYINYNNYNWIKK